MTLMDVAHDFAVVSILLAIGYFLRMKVKLFQRLFLPASIIGGLIGLIIVPGIDGKIEVVAPLRPERTVEKIVARQLVGKGIQGPGADITL